MANDPAPYAKQNSLGYETYPRSRRGARRLNRLRKPDRYSKVFDLDGFGIHFGPLAITGNPVQGHRVIVTQSHDCAGYDN